jgi:hypothetical protein
MVRQKGVAYVNHAQEGQESGEERKRVRNKEI